MQTSRLFEIIYILLEKKTVSAKTLAEHFGVSSRTIYRDLDVLSGAGIPIYTERGKRGGISILQNFVLNKSILNEQEQNEILYALQGLSNIKTDGTTQTLQKLSTIFNKSAADWMKVDYAGWTHENDFFNDFKTAIIENRVIEFNYYNTQGSKTFRRVEPLQVWFKSRAWYLKGFCLTKQGMRLYKLSRIKNLVVTDEKFIIRDDYFESDEGDETDCPQIKFTKIKLRIAPERAFRVYDDFYENMVEKQPDGSFIVIMDWVEDNWLYGFLLSYGRYVEVLEPENLRQFMKAEAECISKVHS